ncbi:uncharacterized protein ACNLHF_002781 isoform 1-T1 [Anomaloglossus baeobatrachus]
MRYRDISCSHQTTDDMNGHLLLPLYLKILMVNIILACLPREYEFNGTCCPMCDIDSLVTGLMPQDWRIADVVPIFKKVSFVKAHCTRELISVCVICTNTTYMDHPNGLQECFQCKECDREVTLLVKRCVVSSKTICGCSAGYFCLSKDCDICLEHKECQPGEYIKEPGTLETDTVCEKCPLGNFSNRENSTQCSPWKDCLESGYILDKEGNSTTDSTCKEKRSHIAAIAAAAFGSTILAVIILLFAGRNRIGKPGPVQRSGPAVGSSGPVQQSGPAVRSSSRVQSSGRVQWSRPEVLSSGPVQQSSPAVQSSGPVQQSGPVQRSSPVVQARGPVQQSSPSVQSSGPIQQSGPVQRSSPAVESGPSVQSSGPVQQSSPAVQARGPVQRSCPAVLSISPVQRSCPSVQSSGPVQQSGPVQRSGPAVGSCPAVRSSSRVLSSGHVLNRQESTG